MMAGILPGLICVTFCLAKPSVVTISLTAKGGCRMPQGGAGMKRMSITAADTVMQIVCFIRLTGWSI